ncbi:hypothetical protein C1H46_045627 [Malus baccata]|uniref:Uncharacterized protein n=1 Tax=Malus baccata TaxID=106549 RepID=A0A540K3R3_MALBA|nr:hypothetical protein C1H46_045627 [Malus baccata]
MLMFGHNFHSPCSPNNTYTSTLFHIKSYVALLISVHYHCNHHKPQASPDTTTVINTFTFFIFNQLHLRLNYNHVQPSTPPSTINLS